LASVVTIACDAGEASGAAAAGKASDGVDARARMHIVSPPAAWSVASAANNTVGKSCPAGVVLHWLSV
jgi:hypothetical protein